MYASRCADDLEGLASHELEDQLLTLNAHITAAVYRFLMPVRTAGCRHAGEANALADRFVDAVEYQHAQVHVEIGGAAVSLHEGDDTPSIG